MRKINFNILTYEREHYVLTHTIPIFKRLKPENKEKINLNILCYYDKSRYDPVIKDLMENGINATSHSFPTDNYMSKIYWAIDQDVEYSSKLDEDVLPTNHYMLDFIIENIDILQNDDILSFMPIVSNGIPSVDYFIDQFMTDEEKKEMYKIFLETNMFPVWGADYTELNKFTTQATEWDYNAYYDHMKNFYHHYKGCHPVRLSFNAQSKILEIILKNSNKFKEKKEFSFFETKAPYICNGYNFIKTKTYREFITNRSLFRDGYDEVPLNLYRQQTGKKFLFINNAFAIHIMYNTVYGTPGAQQLEENFFKNFQKAMEE